MRWPSLLAAACLARGVHAAGGDPSAALATITEKEIAAHLVQLASAPLEGRDSPSLGQEMAARYLETRLREAGYKGYGADGSMLWAFRQARPRPVPERCSLELAVEGAAAPEKFALGQHFVPVVGQTGSAEGALVFLGFGIDSKKEPYDDVRGDDLAGKIAVVIESEPRHRKLFGGPEVTGEADLYAKLPALESAGIAGVLVVRREPEEAEAGGARGSERPEATGPPKQEGIGFRSTWATWMGEAPRAPVKSTLPVLEITAATGAALLGEDPLALAQKIDKSGKPIKKVLAARRAKLSGGVETGDVTLHNVIGRLEGSESERASEHVVIGAHYDHVGTDSRGRIGYGADDNASGTAAVLEMAQALASARPARSILCCFFSAEEDGLEGSRAFCRDPAVPPSAMVAMLNLDMVGRGPADSVVALGTEQNPALEKVVLRAQRQKGSGIKKVDAEKGDPDNLWQRSDHFAFHEIGVPTLFFFESLPISDNEDYHTWRDTIDKLDPDKITRTARLCFQTAWLLATDEDRPPAPAE